MSIPIVHKQPHQDLPPLASGMRYVLARNGLFLERVSALYRSTCRVDSCAAGLADHREDLAYHCAPLAAPLASEMLSFFRWAYAAHGGEAALILLCAPATGECQWLCPPQRVELCETWGGSWYNRGDIVFEQPLELPHGWVILGDAHSHADLPAYASAVDRHDERHKDGLHIVIGRLRQPLVDVFAEFVMDGRRFPIDADLVVPTVPRWTPPPAGYGSRDGYGPASPTSSGSPANPTNASPTSSAGSRSSSSSSSSSRMSSSSDSAASGQRAEILFPAAWTECVKIERTPYQQKWTYYSNDRGAAGYHWPEGRGKGDY